MFRRKDKTPHTPASVGIRKNLSPSVIASGMHVLGNIVSEGALDIDGKIDGNVRGYSVHVRPSGTIRGDVTAEILHVHGEIEGVVKATTVMLYATARVTGTLMHEAITIEDGAFVDGKFKRTDKMQLLEDSDQGAQRRLRAPSVDVMFDPEGMNDNDEPQSDVEVRILENLRLIS